MTVKILDKVTFLNMQETAGSIDISNPADLIGKLCEALPAQEHICITLCNSGVAVSQYVEEQGNARRIGVVGASLLDYEENPQLALGAMLALLLKNIIASNTIN